MAEYKTLPKKFENFAAKWVPGLRVYLRREGMRDADKLIREELAVRLDKVRNILNEAKRERVDEGSLKHLDKLDRAASRVQKVRDTIKFDSRGFRGIFDAEEVAERELNALIDFDEKLFGEIEALEAEARKVASVSDLQLKDALKDFEAMAEGIKDRLNQREEYASGKKPV